MDHELLTREQRESFLKRGHVVLKDCFSRQVAEEWTDGAFDRLGYDREDPSTWEEARIHMPAVRREEVRDFAPEAWAAMCELLGGEERINQPCTWGDSFILNLGIGADRLWEPPSPETPGWHKDGDFFRHFLDSPEQGLLVIVVWSDIEHRGGGTFLACDSVPVVARFLAERPEGVLPGEFGFRDLVSGCRDFVELTGQVGDVVLIHPFALHAHSQNVLGAARLITNPPVSLREPMSFDREAPDDYSLVEQAVLESLGVDRLDFRPTTPREKVVPERVARQQRMLEEEAARLGQG
jgi:hypothetical protein